MTKDISFGQVVKERRQVLGLTQAELARRVGCAAVTIRKVEYDALRPSIQVAQLLALALNIPDEEQLAFVQLARVEKPPTPIPTPSPLPGEIGLEDLTGRAVKGFQLRERIGTGGFGVVYRAIQPSVGREVAVKIIFPRYANHPNFIRRFEAEAQLIARLEHPHIVPLYDYWREPGAAYLIMRLLRGGSLEDELKQGPLPLAHVRKYAQQIGLALDAAHRHGVIHRDIKPANVLLDDDANAYLADFGIAKNLEKVNGSDLSEDGALIGTLAYVSPEQIKAELIQRQTDIYCLGIMLFEMITGQLPFPGPTPVAYLQQHLNDTLPSIRDYNPDLPTELDQVIRRATAKNPAGRYPDVLALLSDLLQSLPSDNGTTARPSPMDKAVIDLTTQEVAALENPYKGLRAFTEADAANFYGRDTLIQELLTHLAEPGDLARFLAVVGPSGSGKSSVVKAGLVPALRRGGLPGSENWFIVDFTPGAHPWEEVEAALLRIAVNPPQSLSGELQADNRGLLRAVRCILPDDNNTELVMIVDQFEELFTLVEEEAVRAHFLDSLLTAVLEERSRLRLVMTLRADFTDRPLQYVDFGDLLRQRTTFVLPLTPEELEQAITRPVQQLGLHLEPELVAAIIHDVGDQPGALPLLQYSLTELFDRRQGRTLTLAAYRESGGVTGALARRADEVYAALDRAGRLIARQLFLRLVTPGEGVEDTRRRVLRSELEMLFVNRNLYSVNRELRSENDSPITDNGLQIRDNVLTEFGQHRLLTFDHDPITRGPTVEVAHEALLREWPRLRKWLNESRAEIRLQRQLAAAAAEWQTANQDGSYLLRGVRLEQFAGWAEGSTVSFTQLERSYLDASLAAQRARQAAEAARQAHERALEQRSRRFLLGLVGVFTVATVIALFLWNTARNNFITSERTRLAAQAQLALDQGEEATLPALLALRSLSYGYSPEADAALLSALSRGFSRQVFVHPDQVPSVAFSPDGKYVLTGGNDGIARLWDAQIATVIRQFPGHTEFVWAVFSPDGKGVLTGSGDGTAMLWGAETAREVWRLPQHYGPGGILTIAFSHDGKYIVTNDGPAAHLWDAQTGEALGQFSGGHTDTILGASFSPDGRYLATASNDRTAILWDLASGQVVRSFTGHAAGVDEAIFSPDGRFLFTVSLDTTARLWEVETGEVVCRFLGHTSLVRGAAFSPDGRLVITGSEDRTARLWDVATCQEVRRLTGHTAEVVGVAFSPDGQYVLTSGVDRTARLWEVETEIEPKFFARSRGAVHVSEVILLMFTPDGKQLLSGNGGGDVDLWDVETRQVVQSSGFGAGLINAMVFSPTGEFVLTAGGDGTATLWDSQSGQPVRLFTGHVGPIWDATLSPDGKTVLTGGEDSAARLWDVQSGATIYQFSGHVGPLRSVAFSPDGRLGLTGGADATARLWDLETGVEIRQFTGHSGLVRSVAFAANGRFVLTGSDDFTARLWDLDSGKVVQQFTGHTGHVLTAVFSPDGRYVLTGSADRTVRLWDIETGQVVRQFPGHRNPVGTLTFSPDSQFVLAAELEAGYLWRISLGDIIAIACEQLGRDFTSEERALYTITGDEPTCPLSGQ